MFKKFLIYLFFIAMPFLANAQQQSNGVGKFSVSPAFELLRSTHSNLFYAPSVKVNYLFKNGWEPGIGIEYSTTPIHHDNEFVLYKLKFIPVYGNLKYNFRTTKKIKPYAEASVGISFNNYDIAADASPNVTNKVSEDGLYIYTGFGTKYSLTPRFNTFVAVGFKGYKMSTNDLDINPHGFSFTLGFTFL